MGGRGDGGAESMQYCIIRVCVMVVMQSIYI